MSQEQSREQPAGPPRDQPPEHRDVLNYEAPRGDGSRVACWVRTFRLALYWWLGGVGAAKMLGGVASWMSVMMEGGPNPTPAAVTSRPAFIVGLIIVAIAGGVANKLWRLGTILLIGAVAVTIADLTTPEPDPWAAGMPIAAAFAAALLLARGLVPTRWGRWVFVSLLIIGVGVGVLALLGLLLLAIVGFRAK